MKYRSANQTWFEKANSGWFGGCHSTKMAWLMEDTQYRWAVNCVNRGGIIQTRPGYRQILTLPAGNLQGLKYFRVSNPASTIDRVLVFAVDGKVYYSEFSGTQFIQPASWETQRLKNIQFNPLAKRVYWCAAEKSVSASSEGTLSIIPTYSILIIQDGTSKAAYWDGIKNAHTTESAPNLETPTGTWMSWTGNRLWVARDNAVIASDIDDPLSFKERLEGTGRGDFRFSGEITGFANTIQDNRQSNLVVFTEENTSTLLASITNRDSWSTTQNFQNLLYANLGCVAGKSIVTHAGLLWWYSQGGLVNSDSAAATLLTSIVKYKDIEMGQSKRNLAPDLSSVCGASFEAYLLESVPSGDELNAHTMVLDYAPASELLVEGRPAWNGVWCGTRPVEWATARIGGDDRCYQASIDYQALTDGSFNHVWEAFQDDRSDVFTDTDLNSTTTTTKNPIYCSFESKPFGDGLDYKRMKHAELDLVEIGGTVNLKVSYGGSKGGYQSILDKQIIATMDATESSNATLAELASRVDFKTQSRRVRTQEAKNDPDNPGVESARPPAIDKYFSLYVQWCGRMGIEAFRIYMEPITETSTGSCETNETGLNVVTIDGTSFKIE